MGAPVALSKHKDIILFDGVCNLCNGAVRFIIHRDTKQRFKFSSLQSEHAQALLSRNKLKLNLNSIILVSGSKFYDRSDAVLEIARSLSGLWPMFYLFKIIPKFIRDFLYNLISTNRYRIFGKTESCLMPTPELEQRFIFD